MLKIAKEILEEKGYRVFENPHFKDLDISFDLLAQSADRLVIFELISDETDALSKMLELQGKAGQLKQYLGVVGERLEIYAVVVVLVEVYEKLFRKFEEARQNSIACRKLLISIDTSSASIDAELKSKLEFDMLPLLPFDESEIKVQHVEGLSILSEKLQDDVLTTEFINAFHKGGTIALKQLIEQKLEGV